MDTVLEQIYSTVLGAAPFVIGAYALMWLVLFVYVVFVTFGLKKTEKRIALLEEALAEKTA
ncbi:MAG: hypothetical protein LBG81_04345 [Coriobacteriaceae bacterium]|jgi:hypothetical protein|nr:hypothetical protein [Coriobacteriaceae bacterium]